MWCAGAVQWGRPCNLVATYTAQVIVPSKIVVEFCRNESDFYKFDYYCMPKQSIFHQKFKGAPGPRP